MQHELTAQELDLEFSADAVNWEEDLFQPDDCSDLFAGVGLDD